MTARDPRSQFLRARLATRVAMAAWTAAVLAVSIGLLADRFEHYAASLLCITPTLLLTAGALYSTRMQSLANDEAERLAHEGVPRGRHGRVHTFVAVLSEAEAEALAGAMEGTPPHRAVTLLAPHLARGDARLVTASALEHRWADAIEARLSALHDLAPRDRSGYRGDAAEAGPAAHGKRVVVYALAALHAEAEQAPMPTEPEEIAAWIDALVPLREDESRAEVATSRTLSTLECDALLERLLERASRAEELPPPIDTSKFVAPPPEEDDDAEDDERAKRRPRQPRRQRGKR